MSMRSRRGVLIFLIALALTGVCVWWFGFHSSASPIARHSNLKTPAGSKAASAKTPIRLIASGDELPHGALTQAAKTDKGYDYSPFFKTIKPYFQSADLRFCNQETVTAGEQYGISGYPAFNVSKDFARNLSSVGCNLISLANNHMNDKGRAGINETLGVWQELKPYAYAGVNQSAEEQQKVRYFEYRGVKFAFVAYTEISNTDNFQPFELNMLSESLVTSQLTEARKQADVVLVSVHWGTEYSDGINSGQDTWSNRFAALGADVVIGTGPHVLEPVKLLPRAGGGETIVWYSLGNMLSAQLDTPSLIGGFAVVDIDPSTKKAQLTGFVPTYMHYEWTPEEKAREDLLARHNLQIYPLDKAAEPLKKSQNNTTVEAQTERVQKLLNTYTKVPILTSDQYLRS
jgi:poly-gamma-glutamate capsule biosynthesis protein CapA/YwtB (metallophosphatase superfamily)